MLSGALVGLLTAFLAPLPVCTVDGDEPLRRAVQFEINYRRLASRLQPVAPHPALCQLARERADEVSTRGSVDVGVGKLNRMTRRVYRLGYRPHAWTQSDFVLNWGRPVLEQWREVARRSYDESIGGDFEHLGIGVSRFEGRPVYAILLALSARTVEWRQVAPLSDLAQVRSEVLRVVNRLRDERGRGALALDPALDRAAQLHAEDLLAQDYYSHRSRDGRTPGQRAAAAGYRARRVVSENIAKGLFTPSEVVGRWLNSSGHRRNLLLRQARDMGVGVAFGETDDGLEVLWVQLIGG